MSRTEKTQPFRIRLWDGTLRRVAVHDHRDGICDLPATVQEYLKRVEDTGVSMAPGFCHWELQYTGTRTCCCPLCHDADGLRDERRADRHRNRRELAELLKLTRHGWRELG
ncbi:hypothetical protein [Arthrobacter bambusae]|uniref:hypothetical protein n=1 Tax=Arthrobacter bambusae TaxID=1338426 RepID=UPI00277D6025|nr:hypothetical protein [Arthrobacter bambusae]MDQ0030432.1 hypothetical protein [Arthrobacter bambusae]MDQ0098349.1 hypothetical protein [Arthrobacter bambusae]